MIRPVVPKTLATLRAALPSGQGEIALLLSGINLMLLNFIIVQHGTVAMGHAEIAVIVFSLAYFSGVSIGYLASDRLSKAAIRRLLPPFMLLQMVLLVGMQPFHYTLANAVGRFAEHHHAAWTWGDRAAAAVLFLLCAAFVTSLYAVFLPRVIEDEGKPLRRCYSIEITGSLLGLLLVPLLASISHEVLLGAYFATLVALALAVGVRPLVAGAMGAATIVFLLGFGPLDRAAAAWTYHRGFFWDIQEFPLTKYTPYHKIEVVKGDGAYQLLLNGTLQFGGDPRRTYAYFVAEYPARLLGAPTVALLGCGSMATLGRIGGFVPSIRIVDIDPQVFAAARTWFQDMNHLDQMSNWTFAADDAKHWLANSTERFDLILHDIPPARSRQVALTYTDEFFRLVKAHLTPRGLFSISSLTEFSPRSHYGKRMVATLASVFDRYVILVHQGSIYFYGGGPGVELPSPEKLRAAVEESRRPAVRVMTQREIDDLIRGETTITISNVGDLIYD
jgi:predicted membrane-bound spermidine synthase